MSVLAVITTALLSLHAAAIMLAAFLVTGIAVPGLVARAATRNRAARERARFIERLDLVLLNTASNSRPWGARSCWTTPRRHPESDSSARVAADAPLAHATQPLHPRYGARGMGRAGLRCAFLCWQPNVVGRARTHAARGLRGHGQLAAATRRCRGRALSPLRIHATDNPAPHKDRASAPQQSQYRGCAPNLVRPPGTFMSLKIPASSCVAPGGGQDAAPRDHCRTA